MNLVDLTLLICLAGWVAFNAIAYALYVIERLREIITGKTELETRLARIKAEAARNTPQPEIETPSFVDGVLLCLSPSMRAEFSAYMDGLPARPITLSSRESLEGLSPSIVVDLSNRSTTL